MDIVMLQTADAKRYLPMLQATAAVNQAYCSRHDISYSQFIGIKRGFHPWQACFNRIVLVNEMIDLGYRGWVFYLDADAFVWDLSFDVRRLIHYIGKPIIMAPGGQSGQHWDVNDGVFLIDLGNETARDLILAWLAGFMAISEERLRAMPEWAPQDIDSDQPLLQAILQRTKRFQKILGHADRHVLNDSTASFVRQILRCHPGTSEDRLEHICKETSSILSGRQSSDLNLACGELTAGI
jgi:hypothetical protein